MVVITLLLAATSPRGGGTVLRAGGGSGVMGQEYSNVGIITYSRSSMTIFSCPLHP